MDFHGGGALAVPHLGNGRVVMVKQFRYAAKDYFVEFPGGAVKSKDPDEEFKTAKAELEELENPTDEEITKRKQAWQEQHDQVIAAGGLHVLGTERHESRRIDNQLRGRSGRQGDPGTSQFYLSMEDNLLRIFAAERMSNLMRKLGIKEGDVIQHPWITKAIENAQRKVEGLNFDIRKNLLEYDDVANDQRKVIYQQRYELLESEEISDVVSDIRKDAVETMIRGFIPLQSIEDQWDIPGLEQQLGQDFGLKLLISQWLKEDENLHEESLHQRILDEINKAYETKEKSVGSEVIRDVEKSLMLQMLDSHWKDHLAAMDHLRKSIHLRGYAQQNPAQEYKRESFEMFTQMLDNIRYEVTSTLLKVEIRPETEYFDEPRPVGPQLHFHHAEFANTAPGAELRDQEYADQAVAEAEPVKPFVREAPKVGRNTPCPCGSGKKYKQCHGKIE